MISANAKNMAAIVLAAGLSQRMGVENKLLLSFGGQSFLQRMICSLLDAGVAEIVVVLGHDQQRIQRQLDGLPNITNQKIAAVVNPDYLQGQMTSVNCGLKALVGDKEGVLICLGDQPLITVSHIQALVTAFEKREPGKQVLVPVYNDQRGNPVVVSEWVRQQVLLGESRLGCRRFIDNNPELVTKWAIDDTAYITDIDTPEEYRTLSLLDDVEPVKSQPGS